MRILILAAIAALATGPAAASAGFWCDIDDDAVLLAVEGGLSRGLPGPPFGVVGTLTLKVADVPADFRDIALGGDDLAQSWFDGDEIRLELYRERAEGLFASINLVIETTMLPEEELSYAGIYTLTASEMLSADASEAKDTTATGTVICNAG